MADINLESGGIGTCTRTVGGLTIRYASSEGCGGTPLLLLSPWPESLFAFAPIWDTLRSRSDLIAVDLPGFGRSDAADELFAPEPMADFVLRLVRDWDLGTVHGVGPDIGTSILLNAAAKAPDTVLSITVGSGAVSYPLEVAATLRDIVEAPGIEVFESMPSRDVVGAALSGIERYELPAEIREDYLASYDGARFAQSTRYVRSYPDSLKALEPVLRTISTPTLIIAGRHDPFVPVSNAEYLNRRLPHSKLEILDAGHYTWEDATEYGQLVSDWVHEGYESV